MLRRLQVFYSCIALPTGQTTLQWIGIRENNCVMHWIEIYSVVSVIHPLSNWAMMGSASVLCYTHNTVNSL